MTSWLTLETKNPGQPLGHLWSTVGHSLNCLVAQFWAQLRRFGMCFLGPLGQVFGASLPNAREQGSENLSDGYRASPENMELHTHTHIPEGMSTRDKTQTACWLVLPTATDKMRVDYILPGSHPWRFVPYNLGLFTHSWCIGASRWWVLELGRLVMRSLCHQTSGVGILISEVVTEVATATEHGSESCLPRSRTCWYWKIRSGYPSLRGRFEL